MHGNVCRVLKNGSMSVNESYIYKIIYSKSFTDKYRFEQLRVLESPLSGSLVMAQIGSRQEVPSVEETDRDHYPTLCKKYVGSF